jgi:murein DD-endopeptidase MepM/ murein hydrolase activator NlpD
MKKQIFYFLPLLALLACGEGPDMQGWQRVELPEGFAESHILSIDINQGDNRMLIGTYGRGALFGDSSGLNWTVFDTSNGLSWNFILGGDWEGDYIVLATLGDGLNISSDGGKSWQRYGYNFFGIEYLYAVGARIQANLKFVPTADGLVYFGGIQGWQAITEKDGLASQYIYDIDIVENLIALGTLHGVSLTRDGMKTWRNFSPNGRFTADSLPACKVRAVSFRGNSLYAGCDDGLYVTSDDGASWARLGQDVLSSEFIHDLVFDNEGLLWIATYKEVASFNPINQNWHIYTNKNGLPGGSINCLGVTAEGKILAGTNFGLYRLVDNAAPRYNEYPYKPSAEFLATEEPAHQWMLRPVSPDEQNGKDQTYLYGSTMGGNFRQHQGNEYNNPEGVPLLAVDNGEIVYTDTAIGHTVLKCDTKVDTVTIYAHYHHQYEILKKVGDKVAKGEPIGTIGKKGNVTNEHLHFEVAVSARDSAKDSVSTTRNSELWVQPLQGCGTIVGNLTDSKGNNVPGTRIYGITKPVPTETPFSFAETYKDKVHPSETYGENFVIGDVPAGDYILHSELGQRVAIIKVHVEPGKITRVHMQFNQDIR